MGDCCSPESVSRPEPSELCAAGALCGGDVVAAPTCVVSELSLDWLPRGRPPSPDPAPGDESDCSATLRAGCESCFCGRCLLISKALPTERVNTHTHDPTPPLQPPLRVISQKLALDSTAATLHGRERHV